MKPPRIRHRWNLTPDAAVRLQKQLCHLIRQVPLSAPPRLVAGADVSFTTDGKRLVGGIIVWNAETGEAVEHAHAISRVTFPYVPGLLSFREAPVVLAAARKLRQAPDVFIFDGHGLAHPRLFGLACHVGLLMDRPSLGCAKSLLCGRHAEPGRRAGASTRLKHRGQVVGRVVRTRSSVKPVYVSVGHRITLDDAARLTLRCCGKYRLPEPTRLAHQLVTRLRKADDH